jgi:hypothetical protein
MRHDELYIADLVDSTRAIREYLDGISRERWDEDRVLRDAVLYRLGGGREGQAGQQLVASHQSRLPRLGAFGTEHGESGPGLAWWSVRHKDFQWPGGAGTVTATPAHSRTSFSASLGTTKDARKIGKNLFPVHRKATISSSAASKV